MKYCSIFVVSLVLAPTYSAELAPVYDASHIDTIFPSGQRNGFCIGYNSYDRGLVLLKTVCTLPTGEEQPPNCVDQAVSSGFNPRKRRSIAASFGSRVKIWDLNQSRANPQIIDTRIDLYTIQLKAPAAKILVASRSMIKLYRIKASEQIVAHNFENDVIEYIDARPSLRNITIVLQDGPQHIIQKEESGYRLYQSPLIPYVEIDQDGEQSDSDKKKDLEDLDDEDSGNDDFDNQPGSRAWRLRSQTESVISAASNASQQELSSLRNENVRLREQVTTMKNALQSIREYLKRRQTIEDDQVQLLEAQTQLTQLREQQ